jgi:DNA-binding GntR family transcriptional regulator
MADHTKVQEHGAMLSQLSGPNAQERRLVPLENRTLGERVHEYLRDEILSDRLPPGTDLQEVGLAASLGVSRGPVREALGRLSGEGLVTIRPRNGAVVRSLSRREFIEAYEVREALETFALQLAVPRITEDDVAGLRALVERMVERAEADDIPSFFHTNAAFHEALVGLSGNRRLRDLHHQVARQLGRYQMRSLALRGNLQRSIAEHRQILDAAQRGDTKEAVQLLSEHIHVPLRRLESASHPELIELGLDDSEETGEAAS